MKISTFIFRIILMIIVFLTPIFLLLMCVKNKGCSWSDFKESEFHGKVTNKYKDFDNHGFLQIMSKDRVLQHFHEPMDNKERIVYEKISIGDSIYKNMNETLLFIQKKQHLEIVNYDTIFKPCKE